MGEDDAFQEILRERLTEAQAGRPFSEALSRPFAAWVVQRARDPSFGTEWLKACHLGDLYLAFACARGDVAALAALDHLLRANVRQHLGQIDASPVFADEVCQQLREQLLVAASGVDDAKILAYEGRGPLGGWLRVAAIRRALNLRRDSARAGARDEASPAFLPPAADPELDYMRERYAPELQSAFEEALAALATDERNVLRMHFLDGLTAEEVAAAYGVHRTTVSRWLTSARENIVGETRRRLKESLRLSDSELESILRLLTSAIDVSIERLLRTRSTGG